MRRRGGSARPSGRREVEIHDFEDAFFKYGREVKELLRAAEGAVEPDLVLTHTDNDRHQDHRLVAELTWNTFRDHLILEYEIPKYDGDLGVAQRLRPPRGGGRAAQGRGVARVLRLAGARRQWFTEDLFLALLRLRGMESRAPSGLAEGFYGRKLAV